MEPDDLRAKRNCRSLSSVKLLISEGIIANIRMRLWPIGQGDKDKPSKVVYAVTMHGFEAAGRIGEFTHCAMGNQDHCARADGFTFTLESLGVSKNVLGSGKWLHRITFSGLCRWQDAHHGVSFEDSESEEQGCFWHADRPGNLISAWIIQLSQER